MHHDRHGHMKKQSVQNVHANMKHLFRVRGRATQRQIYSSACSDFPALASSVFGPSRDARPITFHEEIVVHVFALWQSSPKPHGASTSS